MMVLKLTSGISSYSFITCCKIMETLNFLLVTDVTSKNVLKFTSRKPYLGLIVNFKLFDQNTYPNIRFWVIYKRKFEKFTIEFLIAS